MALASSSVAPRWTVMPFAVVPAPVAFVSRRVPPFTRTAPVKLFAAPSTSVPAPFLVTGLEALLAPTRALTASVPEVVWKMSS